MKKFMLVAALGVTGLMSANDSSSLINNSEKKVKQNFKAQKIDKDDECYEVTYVLSCGERVVDTSCTGDDPILCDHMVIWDLLDEDLC